MKKKVTKEDLMEAMTNFPSKFDTIISGDEDTIIITREDVIALCMMWNLYCSGKFTISNDDLIKNFHKMNDFLSEALDSCE